MHGSLREAPRQDDGDNRGQGPQRDCWRFMGLGFLTQGFPKTLTPHTPICSDRYYHSNSEKQSAVVENRFKIRSSQFSGMVVAQRSLPKFEGSKLQQRLPAI